MEILEDYTFEDFLRDGKTARAIIRSIEVIGEAASKIYRLLLLLQGYVLQTDFILLQHTLLSPLRARRL